MVTIRNKNGTEIKTPRYMVGEGPGKYSADPEKGGWHIVEEALPKSPTVPTAETGPKYTAPGVEPTGAPRATAATATIDAQGNVISDQRFIPERFSVRIDAQGNVLGPAEGPAYQPMASTDTSYQAPAEGAADPVVRAMDSPTPIDSLAMMAAQNQNKGPDYDYRADAYNISQGISGLLKGDKNAVWAEPYLNDVARLAWAREERSNGRASDPRNAPVEYIEKWKDAFYGSDHSVPLVKEVDQQMIDYAASKTPPNKPFRWQDAFGPTGEGGLISSQVTKVDCGPNAFSTILRSRGYNADPAKTYTFALQTKYHNGNEFAGPDAMVRMLHDEAGLEASSSPISPDGRGWEAVDKELAEGRPVILSSRGHYWVVSAKDANGKYYAGPTALKGNPEWLPRGGFVYEGVANTAIFARGNVDPNSRSVQQMNLKPPEGGTGSTRMLLSGQTRTGPAAMPSSTAAGPTGAQQPVRELPPMLAQSKPRPGLVAGRDEPADQMAKVWQDAMDQTGDRQFADGVAALLIGEGGMTGQSGGGAHGPWQFQWPVGEGANFEQWLRETKGFKGSRAEAQQMSKNLDLANEYYMPRVKRYYDKGTAMGYENPVQAIAVGGHNSGAPRDPAVWNNYRRAWEEWKSKNRR
jgi:hypothetical protein